MDRRTSRNSCKLLDHEGPWDEQGGRTNLAAQDHFSHDTRYAFSRHSSPDTLPLPVDTFSLVTFQNTNCSRRPSTVDVLMLFLSMRGSTPRGPRVMVNLSFCAPLTTWMSGVKSAQGVIAKL